KSDPNENYARELQELFCLGADRGYGEGDVRNLARALTGFRNDWDDAGPTRFRYDPTLHDGGAKTIYGKRHAYGWQDGVRAVIANREQASFFVGKLWSYFIPTAIPASTARTLTRLYERDHEVRPVVEAILRHPHLYAARMVKPPVVQAAGMLRAVRRGIDTTASAGPGESAGH